jgi:hypothetical protein
MGLRDAGELLRSRVDTTIEALQLDEKDAAAVKLARQYADLIDAAHDGDRADRAYALRWIGPLLLDTLTELGATPAARARVRKQPPADAPPTRLTQLRAARR